MGHFHSCNKLQKGNRFKLSYELSFICIIYILLTIYWTSTSYHHLRSVNSGFLISSHCLCKSQFLRSLIAVQTFRVSITSARAGRQCHAHCEAGLKQRESHRGNREYKWFRSRKYPEPSWAITGCEPSNPFNLVGGYWGTLLCPSRCWESCTF